MNLTCFFPNGDCITALQDNSIVTLNKSNAPKYLYNTTNYESYMDLLYLSELANIPLIYRTKSDNTCQVNSMLYNIFTNKDKLNISAPLPINAEPTSKISIILNYNNSRYSVIATCKIIHVKQEEVYLYILEMPSMSKLNHTKEEFNTIVIDAEANIVSISDNIVNYTKLKSCDFIGQPMNNFLNFEIDSKGNSYININNSKFNFTKSKNSYTLKPIKENNIVNNFYSACTSVFPQYTMGLIDIRNMQMINSSKGLEYGDLCIKEINNLIKELFTPCYVYQDNSKLFFITPDSGIQVKSKVEQVKKLITLEYTVLSEQCSSQEFEGSDKEVFEKTYYSILTRLQWLKGSSNAISLDVLSNIMCYYTTETKEHCTRIQQLSQFLADNLPKEYSISTEEKSKLAMGAFLHDIGKIFIPPNVLYKKGKLTDEEFKLVKQHTELGADIFKNINTLRDVECIIRGHHERYDGKGYPNRISLKSLPITVSIVNIVDSVDAMLSTRCYKEPQPLDYVINEIKRCSGTQFNPIVSNIFLDNIERIKTMLNIERSN